MPGADQRGSQDSFAVSRDMTHILESCHLHPFLPIINSPRKESPALHACRLDNFWPFKNKYHSFRDAPEMIVVEKAEDAPKTDAANSPHLLGQPSETPPLDDSIQVYDPPTRPDGAINVYNYKGQRFLSEHLLETPPPMKWKDFCRPLLRRFPKHHVPIKWHGCVGCGVEGGVFKVSFGGDGPYALKLVCHLFFYQVCFRG